LFPYTTLFRSVVGEEPLAHPVVEPMVRVPEQRRDIVGRRRHPSPLIVDDPRPAGVDHDVLALEVAVNDDLRARVYSLREPMEALVEGRPVLDRELAKPGDEPVEEVRR